MARFFFFFLMLLTGDETGFSHRFFFFFFTVIVAAVLEVKLLARPWLGAKLPPELFPGLVRQACSNPRQSVGSEKS